MINYTIADIVQALTEAGENPENFKPGVSYKLTDYVEWIVAHKDCGKPLTGMSPRNGWCVCSLKTGLPPEVKSVHNETTNVDEILALKIRCETAEKEVIKLTEKLDKASKKISELIKNSKT